MALLIISSSSSSSSTCATATLLRPFGFVSRYPASTPFSRLCSSSTTHPATCYIGYRVQAPVVLKKRGQALIVAAAGDVDGVGSDGPEPPSGSEKENVDIPVGDLPLESKLQLKLEQKMKMKLAKKIRLRRKRLVRKRHLRKKGRWPPSKVNKNKNV